MKKINFSFFVLLVGCSLSCTRPTTESSPKISVKIPTVSELKNKITTMTLAPLDPLSICFYVNVKAPDIAINRETCAPDRGIMAGGVPAGGLIEVEVPMGKDRVFELIGVAKKQAADICAPIGTGVKPTADRIYILGSSNPTEITSSMSIDLPFTIPDSAQNLKNVNSWVSCPSAGSITIQGNGIGRTLLGVHRSTGASYSLKAQLVQSSDSTQLSGSQYKIQSWIQRK